MKLKFIKLFETLSGDYKVQEDSACFVEFYLDEREKNGSLKSCYTISSKLLLMLILDQNDITIPISNHRLLFTQQVKDFYGRRHMFLLSA